MATKLIIDNTTATDTIAAGFGKVNTNFDSVSFLKTKLTITANIAAGTNFSTIASGTGYTKSGDNGSITTSDALFKSSMNIKILLNGVELDKTTDLNWVTSQTFNLNLIVDSGDTIIIFS